MRFRTKISLLTTSVVIIVGILMMLSIRGTIINAFREELGKKGISIAGNLSDRIANFIPLGDRFQTSKAFNEVMAKEKDLEYIFVTDSGGGIFAHTFESSPPPDILSWNPLGTAVMNTQLLDTEKGYIRDVGVNAIKGTGAELHIGLREDSLRDTLKSMRNITVPIIGLVIFIGIIASVFMSRLISEPLNKFAEFTKVLGKGEFGKKVDVSSGDEIGELAGSFNRLSLELKEVKDKMEEAYAYTHLLQAEKLSSIGQISAGLAHELKNPITALKMLFQSYKEEPDMTKEDAAVITGEIEKIDNILTRFLGFVKQKGTNFSETDLNGLIDRVLSLATFDLRSRGITIQKDMLEALPRVYADRSLLEQVFLNLILNAIEAMPQGGEIRISGKADENFVEVMVWDRGGGIPPDLKTRIFDPFFTTKEKGTGLGLSIAYNIVKTHGGRLYFSSSEKLGTVFTVRLPKGIAHG
ncbi:MAG: HAMP domain-containing protein [Nitrospirae bacterium]|nr:HAMP domain-containing protein [Nitrospirota bacterium]